MRWSKSTTKTSSTARCARADMIGINNRDLKTFVTDLGVTLRLAPRIPKDILVVAESGLASPADLRAGRCRRHHLPHRRKPDAQTRRRRRDARADRRKILSATIGDNCHAEARRHRGGSGFAVHAQQRRSGSSARKSAQNIRSDLRGPARFPLRLRASACPNGLSHPHDCQMRCSARKLGKKMS
jgi:hypothetical protein